MSLLSRLFGSGGDGREAASSRLVGTIRFTFERTRRSTRHLAEVYLVPSGSYRIELTRTGSGAYAPEGKFVPMPAGGWKHAVHMVCCNPVYPLTSGAAEPDGTIAHHLFQNSANPGPHPTSHEARDSFLAIPEAARSFTLAEDSRLVFWIEADDNRGDGVMELRLLRLG